MIRLFYIKKDGGLTWEKNPVSFSPWLVNFPFVLTCLALACLIVALARPQQKFTETNTEGR